MGLMEKLFKTTPDEELEEIVDECLETLRRMSKEEIVAQRDEITSLARSYVTDCVNDLLKKPGKIDIDSILKISRFIDREQAVIDFNIKVNVIKNIISAQGFSTVMNREVLDSIIRELLDELWEYVARKANVDCGVLQEQLHLEE